MTLNELAAKQAAAKKNVSQKSEPEAQWWENRELGAQCPGEGIPMLFDPSEWKTARHCPETGLVIVIGEDRKSAWLAAVPIYPHIANLPVLLHRFALVGILTTNPGGHCEILPLTASSLQDGAGSVGQDGEGRSGRDDASAQEM